MKTEPASEAKERCSARTEAKECEYYLDGESIVYECICGNIEIGGKIYYPEDKVNPLKEEITHLKAELERERELRKEFAEWSKALISDVHFQERYPGVLNGLKNLLFKSIRERSIFKAKN